MKAWMYSVLISLVSAEAVAQSEPLMLKEWGVVQANDGSSVSAVTVLSDQAAFGEWCFFSSKTCTWELLINVECIVGEQHLVLANSTSAYSALKIRCLGKPPQQDLYAYAFNWKDLEDLIRSPTNVSKVAFAMPIRNSEFRVIRFSLDGLRESTGMVERRFFKGAQPASINDQTL